MVLRLSTRNIFKNMVPATSIPPNNQRQFKMNVLCLSGFTPLLTFYSNFFAELLKEVSTQTRTQKLEQTVRPNTSSTRKNIVFKMQTDAIHETTAAREAMIAVAITMTGEIITPTNETTTVTAGRGTKKMIVEIVMKIEAIAMTTVGIVMIAATATTTGGNAMIVIATPTDMIVVTDLQASHQTNPETKGIEFS